MSEFRWWLSKQFNALAWWICPEPYKRMMTGSWDIVKDEWISEMVVRSGAQRREVDRLKREFASKEAIDK